MAKTSDAKLKAIARYKKGAIKKVYIELNRNTDADLIEYLDTVESRQGTMKQALREFMKKGSK